MKEVPVLIVGGGPVDLAASILLSREGVSSLLVERHPGTAVHPKARAINARSMEMYRFDHHGAPVAIKRERRSFAPGLVPTGRPMRRTSAPMSASIMAQ